jgi:predicted RNase H-like HicB family nuclease
MLYPIAIAKGDANTAHGIFIPDIKGCFSAADNYQDVLDNAVEAIELHLEGLVEDGEDIPLPSDMSQYIDDPEYVGMVWALAPVDVNRYLGKTEKINVTLPSRLVYMIDEKVAGNKVRYKSRSAFLAQLAEKDLIA